MALRRRGCTFANCLNSLRAFSLFHFFISVVLPVPQSSPPPLRTCVLLLIPRFQNTKDRADSVLLSCINHANIEAQLEMLGNTILGVLYVFDKAKCFRLERKGNGKSNFTTHGSCRLVQCSGKCTLRKRGREKEREREVWFDCSVSPLFLLCHFVSVFCPCDLFFPPVLVSCPPALPASPNLYWPSLYSI